MPLPVLLPSNQRKESPMNDRFFLVWVTSTLILVPAAWAAILIGFLKCFRFEVREEERSNKSLRDTQSHTTQARVFILGSSVPTIDSLVARMFSETHFLRYFERLSRLAITLKVGFGWLKGVLGSRDSSGSYSIDIAPGDVDAKNETIEMRK